MMKHFDPTGVVPLPAADAPDAEMLDGKLEAKTGGPELGVIKEEIPRMECYNLENRQGTQIWRFGSDANSLFKGVIFRFQR